MLTKKLKVVTLFIAVLFVSAAHAGDVEDGVAAYAKKDYAVALVKLKKAAAQGNAQAQFTLGTMYD